MKKTLIIIGLGLTLGIIGFIQGSLYGGNHGCFTTFMGMRGYEACGNLFGLIGLGLGIGLGVLIVTKKPRQ